MYACQMWPNIVGVYKQFMCKKMQKVYPKNEQLELFT